MASRKQTDSLGLPPGFSVYSPYPFAGLNLSSARTGIRDQQFFDIENFVKVGDGNLRTLWDVGAALYTVSGSATIINCFFYNIAATQYAAVFLSDGTAVQVNVATGAITTISAVTNTFYNGGNLPACIQWGSQYLVISNNHIQNGYWVWDGSLLYTAGSLAPSVTITNNGGGYTSIPTVTAYGGEGTGATFKAVVQNGYVSEIYLTNPGSGYEIGDQVQLLVQGGGSDSQAQLTAILGGGSLSSIVLSNGGSGYTTAPTVNIGPPPAGGTQATATATIASGAVTSITITNAGAGYTTTPIVTLSSGQNATATATRSAGTGATGTAVLTGGAVSSITLGAGGSGYTSIPLVTLGAPPTGGTQATATATISGGVVTGFTVTNGGSGYISAPSVTIQGGAISALTVVNAGTGYTSAPTVTIGPPAAGGTQATATATVSGGIITGFTMTNIGSGYLTTPTVTITSGTGASAYALILAGKVTGITVVQGGSGFTGTPTLTIVGGGGGGATATATVTNGVITSATVTAGGSGYTSTPAVEVESGLNRAATATVSLMPYGISGTALEAYVSRIWIVNPYTPPTAPSSQNNGNIMQVSAPASLADFATSDGGVLYPSTDRFLRIRYQAIRQSNGYLYPIGDSSTAIVSGVNTSGNPATTTFSYQNTDPQVGTPWRDSCQDYGRAIMMANQLGAYSLYGGAVVKVTEELDPLFSSSIFPPTANAITPSSAMANIFGGKYYLLLMTITNPITLATENKMLVWDGPGRNNWTLASQSVSLIQIYTQQVNSNLTAWGTDGTSLYPLFQTPSTNLTKKLSTKLFGGQSAYLTKQAYLVTVQGQNRAVLGGALTFSINIDTEVGSYPLESPDGTNTLSFGLPSGGATAYPVISNGLSNVAGNFLGLSLSTTDADISLNYLSLGYTLIALQMASVGVEIDP